MNPDQVLDQIIQANPRPAEAQAPGTVLTRAALLVELDRRSGDMQTQDKPATQSTSPASPPTSPFRSGRLFPVLVGAAAVMVAMVIGVMALGSESDTGLVDDRPLEEQLVEAIRANDGTRIEALVGAGLDVNANLDPLNPFSAIALIGATGNYELIPVVVAAGYDLEARRSGAGLTVLHTAAEAGDLELISALVEAGADLEGVDGTQQNTAVQYAFYFGRVEAARLLISLGADLDYVNIAGHNVADQAIRGGSREAVALAEELGLTPTLDE